MSDELLELLHCMHRMHACLQATEVRVEFAEKLRQDATLPPMLQTLGILLIETADAAKESHP